MKRASFGLKGKILLSMCPLLLASCLVGYKVFQLGVEKDPEIERALKISEIIGQEETAMISMSDHLRGYLLNPKDKSNYELKKKADETYSDLAKELEPLVFDSKEISEINKKMADYDAGTLDQKETTVADLAVKDLAKAVDYYAADYAPARLEQEKNFGILKEAAKKHSAALIESIETRKAKSSYVTLGILALSTLIGFGITLWVLQKSIGTFVDSINTLSLTSNNMESTIVNLNSQGQNLAGNSNTVAASLEETVASLEEMSSMIKLNSENASQAAGFSARAQDVAVRGESQIQGLVLNMKEISTSSKKIAEITRVIDDIAFQTNLLALNAAVEAARAGEQGKGFAVVADAVRALAQRSAESAKGISELIQDSVDKIENGAKAANSSGEVFTEIVEAIRKVSTLNTEIAASSAEQSSGVTQLTQAMNQIDASVQSNASSSNEITTIAQEINGQSHSVKGVVDLMNYILKAS
jgi:methyl-accepting chemotaxis protein